MRCSNYRTRSKEEITEKQIKTYIIPRGIVNGGIGNDLPRIHNGEVKTSKDLVGVDVKEGRVPHDTRDRTSTTVNSGSAMRRHVNVSRGIC